MRGVKTVAAIAGLMVAALSAPAQTERETWEAMKEQASLACPDYSTDRGNPGIQGVPIEAVRVLAKHHFVLCPDRRLKAPMAVVWYPEIGAFVWNPTTPGAAKAMATVISSMTKTQDFPQGLSVYNSEGKELTNQVVPEFAFKPTYRGQ